MTAIEKYIQGSKRGEFQWNVIEAGTYGESNTVDVEETILEGRQGKITRHNLKEFEAEVDNLKVKPLNYDCNEFTSRKSARSWCERKIKNDIKSYKENP